MDVGHDVRREVHNYALAAHVEWRPECRNTPLIDSEGGFTAI